jgi:hypothetical protein
MAEKPRVMLYVDDIPQGALMESIEEAKQKAKQHIEEGRRMRIEIARSLMPLETLTYNYDLQDWSSRVG